MAGKGHKELRICLIAGEPSGDFLGGQIMAALHTRLEASDDTLAFSGVGGAHMTEQGLQSLFPMDDLSVMGVAEILPRLPKLLRRINQMADYILTTQPDIVITIDAPDFCFRVVEKVRKKSQGKKTPHMVHCVAPTVWAWRPERAAYLAGLYDGLLCLFPFEPPYFEKEGLPTCFIGHPMIEKAESGETGATFREQSGIGPEDKILGLLFGSRGGEIKKMGPLLREAALTVIQDHKDINFTAVAPTLPSLQQHVQALLHDFPCPVTVITEKDQKWPAFKAMNYALATSGTVGLELAVADVPHVIAYRMNSLTWRMIKNKLTTSYAHLVNIMLQKPVVPEFIQQQCRPSLIAGALTQLIEDQDQTAQQLAQFSYARALLSGEGSQSPSERAAQFILKGREAGL